MRRKYLSCVCLFVIATGCLAADKAGRGFLEGRLTIATSKEVELAGGNPPKFSRADYTEYPLIVLGADGNKEIARVTANENGNYRVALLPGDYFLDVAGRAPKGHVRAKPQRFTIVSGQVTHVDMDIDTGVR
jgi:hypothetical protein